MIPTVYGIFRLSVSKKCIQRVTHRKMPTYTNSRSQIRSRGLNDEGGEGVELEKNIKEERESDRDSELERERGRIVARTYAE